MSGTTLLTAGSRRSHMNPGVSSPVTSDNARITGGTLDGVTIGAEEEAVGYFTTLAVSGATDLGDGSANWVRATGAATGSAPGFAAQGSDSHVNLLLAGKGNAAVWATRLHVGTTAPTANPVNTFNRLSISAPAQAVTSTAFNLARVGGNFTGTLPASAVGLGMIVAADFDTVNAPNGFALSYVGHNVTSGAIGGRTAAQVQLNINANVNAGTMRYYTAGGRWTIARGSMGGVHFGPLGAVFGGNDVAELRAADGTFAGAGMNVAQLVSYEANVAAEDGTQAQWSHAVQIVQLANHVARAFTSDAGIIFANQPLTAGTWHRGISFGAINGKWAFRAKDSQLISSFPANGAIVSDAYAALDGIDFSRIAFTRAALRTAEAELDGAGNFGALVTAGTTLQALDTIRARTATVNTVAVQEPGLFEIGVTPTLAFDAPPAGGSTATASITAWTVGRVGRVDNGGSNYARNDILLVDGGTGTPAYLKVARADATTGAITDLVPLKWVGQGSIADTTLTVTSTTSGTLEAGDPIHAPGITNGTYIVADNGGGSYTVSRAHTLASTWISAQGFSGSYTVRPGAATTVQGGSGTGATVTLMFGIAAVSVTATGSNYPEFPRPKLRNSTTGRVRDAMFLVSMTATQRTLKLNDGKLNVTGIPTSAAGLTSGDLWLDGSTLKVA